MSVVERQPAPSQIRLLLPGGFLVLAACVSAPVDPPPKVKTWQPEVNEQGVTREQAELACRQGMIDAGFGSVVLMSTMVDVCMRDQGFELK